MNVQQLNNVIARKVQIGAERWASAYWHDNPFCSAPKADEATYRRIWENARSEYFPEIDAFERNGGHAVDPDWLHELALHTQVVVKNSPICYQHGRVLYTALRNYLESHDSASINVLETGTARGFSSTVMAKALSDAGNAGRIITVDLLPHDREMYWNCIDDLEGMKTREKLLQPWRELIDRHVMFFEGHSRIVMNKLKMGRIHFAFLDGAHSYKDVMIELALVTPRQRPGDVIVFDDYNPTDFPGIVRAVDEGCRHYGYRMDVISSKGDRAYVVATRRE